MKELSNDTIVITSVSMSTGPDGVRTEFTAVARTPFDGDPFVDLHVGDRIYWPGDGGVEGFKGRVIGISRCCGETEWGPTRYDATVALRPEKS